MNTILVYDGSFDGLLCAIFYFFEARLSEADIQSKVTYQPSFFANKVDIYSEENKAQRVWKSLSKKGNKKITRYIFKAFLSESLGIENLILHLIRRIYNCDVSPEKDFSDEQILSVSKLVKMVDREKHRMNAFVRFRLTKENIYMATVAPDFNVLPLNASHFERRYADQKWLIYDIKRTYGIYYDLRKVTTITLDLDPQIEKQTQQHLFFTSEELDFQDLWQNYFKSTNIEERKNMKLHLQHVPKRYWRYLSEKSISQ